jgi:hypothetical protein
VRPLTSTESRIVQVVRGNGAAGCTSEWIEARVTHHTRMSALIAHLNQKLKHRGVAVYRTTCERYVYGDLREKHIEEMAALVAQ